MDKRLQPHPTENAGKNRRRLVWIAGILFAMALWVAWDLPLLPTNKPTALIKIPKELHSAREIANLLAAKGALRHPRLFEKILKLGFWDTKIQRGAYSLSTPEPWPALIRKLTRGETFTIKITIPEGWRAIQIAERLQAQGIVPAKDFLDIVNKNQLEGFLFPSTYHFELDSQPEEAALAFTSAFHQMWRENFANQTPPMNFTSAQVVTLASIIEREATVREEMPLIASVYMNRLRKGWRLEADPTVQYALGYWKGRINYKDIKMNSPYNTYQRRGLPPAPICSPSKNSIAAVFSPAATTYMYFVATGNGGHAFFENLQDHNRAKQKMIKEREMMQKK